MKANKTLNALFNLAFGQTVLHDAVLAAGQACTELDAKLTLAAGYIAASRTKDYQRAVALKDECVDSAAAIFAMKKSERSKEEQAIYMKSTAKYLYYFGSGKSSKKGKATTAKSKPAIDPWAMIVAEFLSQHPRKLAAIAAELGINKPE